MAEISDVRKELEKYAGEMIAEVRWLRQRVAELDADAARYRWLRDKQKHLNGEPFIAIRVFDGYHFAASDPDAAIDAARQETGE